MAVRVINPYIQLLGGYGYMKEYGIERAYRDARLDTSYNPSISESWTILLSGNAVLTPTPIRALFNAKSLMTSLRRK
jgi:hypothetical protein